MGTEIILWLVVGVLTIALVILLLRRRKNTADEPAEEPETRPQKAKTVRRIVISRAWRFRVVILGLVLIALALIYALWDRTSFIIVLERVSVFIWDTGLIWGIVGAMIGYWRGSSTGWRKRKALYFDDESGERTLAYDWVDERNSDMYVFHLWDGRSVTTAKALWRRRGNSYFANVRRMHYGNVRGALVLESDDYEATYHQHLREILENQVEASDIKSQMIKEIANSIRDIIQALAIKSEPMKVEEKTDKKKPTWARMEEEHGSGQGA